MDESGVAFGRGARGHSAGWPVAGEGVERVGETVERRRPGRIDHARTVTRRDDVGGPHQLTQTPCRWGCAGTGEAWSGAAVDAVESGLRCDDFSVGR